MLESLLRCVSIILTKRQLLVTVENPYYAGLPKCHDRFTRNTAGFLKNYGHGTTDFDMFQVQCK